MIEIRDLEFQHGSHGFSLRIPELRVEEQSTVAMIGPSGSGKTTLLNLLAGVLVPERGSIKIDGRELTGLGEAARRAHRIRTLGLVFQEFELLSHLHVLDNILLPYRLHPALKVTPQIRERAASLAGEVGLGDKLKRRVPQLSQGERQRVAVCRALVTEAPLLMCDEPTGNLDPANKDSILDILFEFVERRGATLVTVTHDHALLDRFATVVDFQEFQSKEAADSA